MNTTLKPDRSGMISQTSVTGFQGDASCQKEKAMMQQPPQDSVFSNPDQSKKPAHSTLVSRNVTIAGHRTSVRLEPEMWTGLTEICRRERMIMHEVCTTVSMRKQENTSLTAAIRVFVMAYFRAAATEDGHSKAGHGYGVAMGASTAGAAMPRAAATNGGMPAFAMSAKMDGTRRF